MLLPTGEPLNWWQFVPKFSLIHKEIRKVKTVVLHMWPCRWEFHCSICTFLYACSVMSNFETLWTVAHQASLCMLFPRQEYWKWVAVSFSRGSSQPRDWAHISCLAGGFFITESPGKPCTFLRIPYYSDCCFFYLFDVKTPFVCEITFTVLY